MQLLRSFTEPSRHTRLTGAVLVGWATVYLTGGPVEALFSSSLCLQKMAVRRRQASQSIPLAERGVGAEHGGSWATGAHHPEHFTHREVKNHENTLMARTSV